MPCPDGPYRTETLSDGTPVPYFIIPFDREGTCTGPRTRRSLLSEVADGSFTDLYLFSHGWNNDWQTATRRYDAFIQGFAEMRRESGLPMPTPYRPLLVGAFWPSTALVFGEDEVGPAFASAGDRSAAEQDALETIAELVDAGDRRRVCTLLARDRLDGAEALELARLARVIFEQPDDETGEAPLRTAEEIVGLWNAKSGQSVYEGPIGTIGDVEDALPAAAGLPKWLDPRPILRLFTVWMMKDRAGRVGSLGVQPLLRDLLASTTTEMRTHLIGHSFGCKVMLSAVGYDGPLPRPVDSILLLQPAISHLCFAASIPGSDAQGGYRATLDRVVQPIFSTFSERDDALHNQFHRALRRSEDVGEARIAGAGEPPSRHAALGGFGPRGAGERLVAAKLPGDHYVLEPGVRVYGLDGSATISGHGDVSNRSTWWALYQQITASREVTVHV